MSVQIDIGPYRLESYSHGWTTGERKERKDGTDYLAHQKYHGTVERALEILKERWLRDGHATDLTALHSDLQAFRAEISGVLATTSKVIDRKPRRTA